MQTLRPESNNSELDLRISPRVVLTFTSIDTLVLMVATQDIPEFPIREAGQPNPTGLSSGGNRCADPHYVALLVVFFGVYEAENGVFMAKSYMQYGVAYWYLHYLPAAVGRYGNGCLQL